jgi:ribosomal-protein-alanine N-acetyltransferase
MDGMILFAPEHVAAVMAIEQRSFAGLDPWAERSFRTELVNPNAIWLVAVSEGKVVGYGGGWIVLDAIHVLNLAVDPDHRRQGIARRLMEALLAGARVRGCRAATLEVRKGNASAIRLYEGMGFVSKGVRPGHYLDGEDALICWLDRIPE